MELEEDRDQLLQANYGGEWRKRMPLAEAVLALGPVPIEGEDRSYSDYVVRAEKAPGGAGCPQCQQGSVRLWFMAC